ncbi:uncharacterized protein K452DRAFT_234698 [Aplosporella prunicola CBS 121167]|uniref:MARVEL domain-containing protein n=1 Tax=Aplosporella prunicola CBS 121167 TaxID=1176127 RepID=A0A6A6B365_9PEZI|nr:uncharacterized protein K452DRAFT_234698 [Aplosporella prunicola CBS 121167]KAF2138256.1 hypothetical protein K452DRAFT_234698 [Aplosporella prunicola CBS 121167]
MPVPAYGAAPLSKTFALVRLLEVVSMIIVVGIAANFVNDIVTSGISPPKEVVGTLTVTCLATLYSLVSIAFFWSEAYLGLLVMTAVDFLLSIAFIVVAVCLGKPISFLNCPNIRSTSTSITSASAYAYVTSIENNLNVDGSTLSLASFAGATKANCYESKTIWGLSIVLCILYTTSCILLPTLFFKNKKAINAATPAKAEP